MLSVDTLGTLPDHEPSPPEYTGSGAPTPVPRKTCRSLRRIESPATNEIDEEHQDVRLYRSHILYYPGDALGTGYARTNVIFRRL